MHVFRQFLKYARRWVSRIRSFFQDQIDQLRFEIKCAVEDIKEMIRRGW